MLCFNLIVLNKHSWRHHIRLETIGHQSYLSKYPRVSVSSLHSGYDLRLAVLLDPDHWRIGPKDWSIVIDVLNQD